MIEVVLHLGPHDQRATLSASPDETLGLLIARAALDTGIDPNETLAGRKSWTLATADGSFYQERPFISATKIGSIAQEGTRIDLYLDQYELCMHGSPWVRGRGYLCGSC
jgi:hypothetical protein